jgi:prevent-host-death family protein
MLQDLRGEAIARIQLDQLDQLHKLEETSFMSETLNLYEAKSHLSELVERAAKGEEIVIAKAGKPMARLVALQKQRRPKLSSVMGKNFLGVTYMAPDFEEDLPIEMFLRDEKESH